jgi:hypothetical protein
MTGFHSKQDMAAGKQKEYDPCPGCIVGTVCRTPNCGRLKLPVDHPFRNAQPAQEPWDWAAHEYDGVHRKAQPAQKPVAHFGSAYVNENGVHITTVLGPVAIPQDAKLYTAPPQREWVGLTDEDLLQIQENVRALGGKISLLRSLSIDIEAALKEKNFD